MSVEMGEAEYCILSGNIRQDIAVNEPQVALEDVEAAVSRYHPDIICLQEATVGEKENDKTGYLGQVAIAHDMELEFSQTRHLRKLRRRRFEGDSRVFDIHSGIANLVRSELAVDTVEIPLGSQRLSTPVRRIGRRALLVTTVRDEERPLHIVNAHLSYPTGINRGVRRREWKRLIETVDALDGDVVVAGDFNAGPKSQLVKWCNERWNAISDQTLPTWHNLKKFMKRALPPRQRTIDYVFTNKDFQRRVTVQPLDRGSSDHTWHAISIGKQPGRQL